MTSTQLCICSPETYKACSTFINNNINLKDKQWVYSLIDGTYESESILIENEDWLMCYDKHNSSDPRYLVVFKDLSLLTIRDLSDKHIHMLEQVQSCVLKKLKQLWPKTHRKFSMYFHYMPSVFQLHMHVAMTSCVKTSPDRMHRVGVILRNLRQRSDYYRDALILMPWNRFIKTSQVYSAISTHAEDL